MRTPFKITRVMKEGDKRDPPQSKKVGKCWKTEKAVSDAAKATILSPSSPWPAGHLYSTGMQPGQAGCNNPRGPIALVVRQLCSQIHTETKLLRDTQIMENLWHGDAQDLLTRPIECALVDTLDVENL